MFLFALQGFWNFIPKAALGVLCAALACFLVAGAVSNAGLKHKIVKLTAERDAAISNYARCQSNRITLETAVEAQNSAVEAMRADDARRAREGEEAMRRARAGAVEANRRAEAIRGMVSQQACGDDLILRSVR